MNSALLNFIREQFPDPAAKPSSRDLTVGVEHEFFLMRDGCPCTHLDSQSFLRLLSSERGWKLQSEIETQFGSMIDRVSMEDEEGRYTAVKYDHHPHQLEVAFAYRKTIGELFELVDSVLRVLKKTAATLGLELSSVCQLEISPCDPRVVSTLESFRNLRAYRSLLLERGPFKGAWRSSGYENYAAVIAATQTHIGGTNWWANPGFVNFLYCFEPQVLPWSFAHLASNNEVAESLIVKRWSGYRAVFHGKPLVGFPDLERWDFESWVEALLRSPICGKADDKFASRSLAELGRNPFSNWGRFLKEVRDLQIIRPRIFGTLEFRSDPAQKDAEGVCAVAALRLGLCAVALFSKSKNADFRTSRKVWWENVTEGAFSLESDVIEKALEGLQSRGYGEELHLREFSKSQISFLGKAIA